MINKYNRAGRLNLSMIFKKCFRNLNYNSALKLTIFLLQIYFSLCTGTLKNLEQEIKFRIMEKLIEMIPLDRNLVKSNFGVISQNYS